MATSEQDASGKHGGRDVYDVVVVGAGLAGSVAARDLAEQGKRVLVLEARTVPGGRTVMGRLEGTDLTVEMGGSFVPIEHSPYIAAEVERYGLGFDPLRPQETYAYLLGEEKITNAIPISAAEIIEFERLCFRFLTDAARLDQDTFDAEVAAELDVPWDEYLDSLDPAPAARDAFNAWVGTESGRDLCDVSAFYPLQLSAAAGLSVAAWHLSADSRFEGGTKAFIDALLAQEGLELRTDSPVKAVAQTRTGVEITLEDGSEIASRAAVMAVPVNCWKQIDFTPELSSPKQTATRLRMGGNGVKGWAIVDDAPPRLTGMAASGPIKLFISEYDVGSSQAIAFFGRSDGPDAIDVNSAPDVERAFQRYAPGCKVRSSEGVDWAASPYSEGAWASVPVGLPPLLEEVRAPEGRLAFATADIARHSIMWMEGAVESGRQAALATLSLLTEGDLGDVTSSPS